MAAPARAGISVAQARARMVEELARTKRFLLTCHEGPDGDALGSMLGLHKILSGLGKDSVMFLAEKEFPLPVEYRFLPLQEVFHEAPADLADRTIVFLDCGNIDRMPVDWLSNNGNRILNIDHHHDNTRFGDVNLVETVASSTAEIVYRLSRELGAEINAAVAGALYVGIVTDTGRFSYQNTSAETHRVAAELVDAGVNVDDIYRRLYERAPLQKLHLLARALDRVELREDGMLAITYVSVTDYEEIGAEEVLTEGVIDLVRSLEGTRVAAVVRDREAADGDVRKVSLRSSDGEVDVSAIARAHGGGGHARAAGFSTERPYAEIADVIGAAVREQLG